MSLRWRPASFETAASRLPQDDEEGGLHKIRHGEERPELVEGRVSNHALRRSEIVAVARSWLGTPYQHQASLKGVGCDCLGLVRGVWRELYGEEPEAPPPYRADWAETGSAETLLEAAGRHLVPVDTQAFQPGDVLLFRMSADACVKHAAIVCAADPGAKIIHAYWGRACVESWLGPWWRRRLAAAFSFPGVE